jgi:hypothetical protein
MPMERKRYSCGKGNEKGLWFGYGQEILTAGFIYNPVKEIT